MRRIRKAMQYNGRHVYGKMSISGIPLKRHLFILWKSGLKFTFPMYFYINLQQEHIQSIMLH